METVCLWWIVDSRGQSMLTDTRNEARLVFPQRGWGPKYPSSRGLILSAIRLFGPIVSHAETPSSNI